MMLKRKTKKALSLLLVITLTISSLITCGVFETFAGKLSFNGTFESLDGWSYGKYQALKIELETEDGHNSKGAMKFSAKTNKTGQNEVMALSDKFSVSPSKIYSVSYWMKQCNLYGAVAYIFVFGIDAAGNQTNLTPTPISQLALNKDGSGWNNTEDTFTTNSDTVAVAIRMNVLTDGNVYKPTAGGYFLLDDMVVTEKGDVQEKIVNDGTLDGGFERVYSENPVNWEILGKTYFEVSAQKGNAYEGDHSLKITSKTDELNAYQQINSNTLELLPNTKYEISYFVKNDGLDGATGYISLMDKDGKFVEREDLVRFDISNGFGSEWKRISAQFTTGDNATDMKLRITVAMWTKAPRKQASVYIDSIKIENAVEDNKLNLGFESGLHNWQCTLDANAKIDADVYHGGKQSLCIKKDDMTKTSIISKARIPVSFGQTLLFGGYLKSCDGKNSKVRINLLCYDENGSCINADTSYRKMLGRNVPVNADETPSDWTRQMIAVAVPDNTVSVGFEICITEGSATVWVDDLFYRVSNISTDEKLVDYSDFAYTDNNGKVSEWETFGKAELKTVGEQPDAKGELNLSGKGSMEFATDYLLSGSSYDIIFENYTAPYDMNVTVRFYDYKGSHLVKEDVKSTLKKGTDATEKISLDVPSCATAEIVISGEKSGVFTLEKLSVINVYKPNAAQSWMGRWIWYNEDTLTNAQYETRYFRQTFTLNGTPTYAPLQISADDNYTVYVNGVEIGSNMGEGQDRWQSPATYDILKYLKKGENVLCVAAKNYVSYAGLVYDCRVTVGNETVMVCSEKATVKVSKTAAKGWTAVDFDDSSWRTPKEIGPMGSSPWGSLYFNSALYAENKIEITEFKTDEYLKADSTVKINAVITIEEKLKGDFPFEVYVYKKNSSKQITSAALKIVKGGNPDTWKTGKNSVVFEMKLPDYLETGSYTLQLSDAYYYLTNTDVIDRMFATIKVVSPNEKSQMHTASVKMLNGKPTVFVDSEAKTSLFYLSPAGDLWWDMSKESKYMEETQTEFYVSNRISLCGFYSRTEPIWLAENTIDYDAFDRYIYEALSAAPDANIIVDIGMQAPKWWLDTNPDEAIKIYDSRTGKTQNSTTAAASFASEKYRKDAGEVLRKLLEHMMSSTYIGHIVGIKIQDGETQEYMTEGVEDWTLGDFSVASLNGFRKYLKEKYKTNAALQKAYGSSKVTFDNVVVPDWEQRGVSWLSKSSGILDPATNQITIDYNYYSGLCATETLLYYADIVKKETKGKMLCGAYHCYLWTFSTAGGANGSIHPAVQKVLNSENIDFICSPFVYGERTSGEAPAYDAMLDGVLNAGKLYILEIDTRSVFDVPVGNADWDADVGYCYTLQESIDSIKRDISSLIAKGAGFWIFNMYGSWWYEDQILKFISDVHDEMQYATYLSANSKSDIAVFVDEEIYAHFSPTDVYGGYETFYFLFNQQRRNLAKIGAGYDTYSIGDLVNGNLRKEYKINIILSPFCLNSDERNAIKSKLMRDDKIIVWEYLPGLSDGGANNLENIRSLTGFTVGIEERRGLLNGIMAGGHKLTEGLAGHTYGNDLNSPADSAGPLPYIEPADGITCLAKYSNNTDKYAMALKKENGWTSIYSTVPNIPSDFFRNLLETVNCSIYSDQRSDIINTSDSYISVYSFFAGERTITLPNSQKNCSVYDVYTKSYMNVSNGKFTYYAKANETHLFRLGTDGKVAVVVLTQGGHAKLSSTGITEVKKGGKLNIKIDIDSGYYLEKVFINGEAAQTSANILLKNITAPVSVRFVVKQIKTYTFPESKQEANESDDKANNTNNDTNIIDVSKIDKNDGEPQGHIEEILSELKVDKTKINGIFLAVCIIGIMLIAAVSGSLCEYGFTLGRNRRKKK